MAVLVLLFFFFFFFFFVFGLFACLFLVASEPGDAAREHACQVSADRLLPNHHGLRVLAQQQAVRWLHQQCINHKQKQNAHDPILTHCLAAAAACDLLL